MEGSSPKAKKRFHTASLKKSVIIKASKERVWSKISNIVGLSSWLIDVKKTVFLSKIKRGVGAVRRITFKDGTVVEEHVVGWKTGQYFSYIAVSGLPLRGYHATLAIQPLNKKMVRLSWESYLNTEMMTKKKFADFLSFMESFYETSLKNLKSQLEK